VGVECALDVWPRPAGPQEDFRAPSEAQPDTAAIERAIALLERAKHPLIVVGSGAQDASSEITALAEKLGAPVLAHRMGHGVIDSRHRLSMNVVAGRDYWAVADVVLAIGTRLQFQQIQWGLDDAIKVIRIDTDPTEIARWREPEVGIVADARAATRLILDNLGTLAVDETRLAEIDRIKARAREAVAYLEPQNSLLRTIREVLPEDGIFVDELTQLGYVSRLTFPVYRPRTFLSPGYQGTLGWGLATGLGAKVACPQSDVLVVSGDGGFMFTVQELATAVQFRIPIVVLLVNDGGFGNVRRTQIEEFGGRTIASDLTNPDFVRLAESFGARGIRVEAFEDLGPALKQAFASGEPTVVELRAGEMPSPWKFLRFGRARPVSQV
jgi:acetolactate synthase-1/2/3 large subunit